MKFLKLIIFLGALMFVLESCAPSSDPKIAKGTHLYFSDYSGKRLGVVDLSALGTATTLFDEADGLDTVSGIAIDFKGMKIYAAEELNDRIVVGSLDGSGTLSALYTLNGDDSIVYEPTAIALDPDNNAIYWANSGSGQLKKANLDGSGNHAILYDSAELISYCYGLQYIKRTKERIYSDFGKYAGIYIGNLTSGRFPGRYFYPGYSLHNPAGIFVDEKNYRVYWADETVHVLGVGSLSSYAFQVIYDSEDSVDRADGMAVDLGNSKIYWTEPNKKRIMRANLDGSGTPEVVLEDVESYCIVLKFDNQ